MTHISPATEQALRKLPKAELHLHIEGTLEPKLALKLAERNNISLPFADLDDLKAHYEFENLQSFLDLYYQLMSVLRTRQDFTDLMLAYLARANADGVRRAEIFFDPQVHMNNGLDFDVVLDGLLEGLRIGHERFGIDGGLIMCIIRDMPVDSAEALLDTAASRAGDLLGIGLDSAEVGYPPELFSHVYERAARLGLHLVAHAGEEGPADYVRQALDSLHVERIDHGVRTATDGDLVARIARDGIALTVCPLSNHRLQVVRDVADLPVRQLFDAGVKVTLNSDDPAYFGGYIGDNYITMARTGMSLDELATIAEYSLKSSFATPEQKTTYANALADWKRIHL
ncbi:adenosine deaminase [Bifidobacterium dentium]|uniref:adenosine deaminase n=1 Tax=Bifidobacterium dentium TaxID=1689 RepID=UPI0018B068D7|nr:adenosine deaminase [Bifidobacterium dentium]MBF9692445.1 adenosine deaminase [Bifidobacterium dentium]MBF9698620.1 adenosine deaminase [Bifidobacterium dentium]